MIYEFKCRATGSIIMTSVVAERILSIVGKSTGPKGIISVPELSGAIQSLERAVAEEKASGIGAPSEPKSSQAKEEDLNVAHAVSLSQRAFPMIQMMKAALAAQKDITWGV
jgi:hypothetical protein